MSIEHRSFFNTSLVFSSHFLWLGFIVIAIIVFFVARYHQSKAFDWQVSSLKSYCQEQQQNRLQRFSQFNDELMNYAIAARDDTTRIASREYLSHRNILRFILFSGSRSYSIKKHWYKENTLKSQSVTKFHMKDLIFWLSKEVYSLDIQHPMYFLDSPFQNMLVIVPLTVPSKTNVRASKEIAIFEIEKEALVIAMGESKVCPYAIFNHKGQSLFNEGLNNVPSLLALEPSIKGEIWVNGDEGKDIVLFEQHPSSIVIAHKLLLQNLYQSQKTYLKNALFVLGIIYLLWCFIVVLMSISVSRPLERFRQSLLQLSKGDFRSIPRLPLKGELGQMEKTIVKMSETLQKQQKKKPSRGKNESR